jgi:MULE transposase domain
MGKIELEKYSLVSEIDKRPFLIANYKYLLPQSEEKSDRRLHSMIMWAHPDLIYILRRRSTSIYIDCTFRCVPRPYTQCLIIMVYDDETNIYVPAVYILLDNKNQWAYWHALHIVLVETETKLYPATITCDFEMALLNALKEQLPNASIVGCLFHFKQALRRKMKRLYIPEAEISQAMKKGKIDILTTIRTDTIPKTLSKLKRKFVRGESKAKWETFFKYLNNTWIKKHDVRSWNISDIEENGIKIYNRTNNALEGFNRILGEQFSTPHPNLLHLFVLYKTYQLNIRSG